MGSALYQYLNRARQEVFKMAYLDRLIHLKKENAFRML